MVSVDRRRTLKLALDVLLMLTGALLGIATNYATGETDHVPPPYPASR
jgi:hypothetical protein